MKIAVIGVGHVGLITVACMAYDGHDVVGLETDPGRVDMLREGRMPFYEHGLADLVADGVEAGRISFTTAADEALSDAEVVFICVGTPRREDGSPDLSYVQSAAATGTSGLRMRRGGEDIENGRQKSWDETCTAGRRPAQ